MEICFSGGCNSLHVDHHHNQPLYFFLCISILFSVENQFKRHHDQGTYIKKNICCGLNSHKRKHLFGVQSIIIMARYGGMQGYVPKGRLAYSSVNKDSAWKVALMVQEFVCIMQRCCDSPGMM